MGWFFGASLAGAAAGVVITRIFEHLLNPFRILHRRTTTLRDNVDTRNRTVGEK